MQAPFHAMVCFRLTERSHVFWVSLRSVKTRVIRIAAHQFEFKRLIDWGFNAVFNNFSVISRRPVHLLMHLLVFVTPVLHTAIFPSNWLLFHIDIAHWWKTNDACRIDFRQSSKRKLIEPGFELTTTGLTARVATDWATRPRLHLNDIKPESQRDPKSSDDSKTEGKLLITLEHRIQTQIFDYKIQWYILLIA